LAVKQGVAVQKKQDEGEGTPKRVQAMKARKGASPKVTAPEEIIVTPAKKEKAERIRKQLLELYPKPPIPLDHQSDFQLLVAVMLSAQVLTHFQTPGHGLLPTC
jgi:uncharacterized protein (DUF4415 family)